MDRGERGDDGGGDRRRDRRAGRGDGARDLLREDGHLVARPDAASAAAGRAAWQAADVGTARVEEASAADRAGVQALVPGMTAAIRFTGSGQIADLGGLATAPEAALAAAGVRFARRRAELTREGGRVAIAGVEADRVVVAAGIGSRPLIATAGHRVPLIAERGYHIRRDRRSLARRPAALPPVVFENRSIIVTRYADSVQGAGFVELGRTDAAPDPRKWQRLERHIAELGLPIAGPFRRWMGARPTLPDYRPIVGR